MSPPNKFTASNSFAVILTGKIEYPGYTSYFFNAPAGTSAFKVEAALSSGTVELRLMNPAGSEIDYHSLPRSQRAGYRTGGTLTRTVPHPEPGESYRQRVTTANRMADVADRINDASLGSRFLTRSLLIEGSRPQIFEIDIPAGTEQLVAHTGNASGQTADIDSVPFRLHRYGVCVARYRIESRSG